MTHYVASVSFGKDSLAMLLKLIQERLPLDEVIFYDTGMEFQAVYDARDKVLPLLLQHNIKYTEMSPKYGFLWKMFEKPVNEGKANFHYGYSWCGGVCRWGTTDKNRTINAYKKSIGGTVVDYVGIAVDEPHRYLLQIDSKTGQKSYHDRKGDTAKRYPLAEWGMTEAQCLQSCYENGFFWEEWGVTAEGDPSIVRLYDLLDRVSCWCCANKNLKELKNIYTHLPQYWKKLKELQLKTDRPMKGCYKGNPRGVFELEDRFRKEIENGMA